LLTLVRSAFGPLNAKAGIPKKVRRVGHAQRVFTFLWECKCAGKARDHLVEEGVGDRCVLEVEEADIEEGMLELLDKDGSGVWRGE